MRACPERLCIVRVFRTVEPLTAFELALRDADIEQQNLVAVSEILPPGRVELAKWEQVSRRCIPDHVRCVGPHRNE
jgi:pyruvoyl-dependent arginine decarboxylase (PvlArgDC)